MRSDIDWDDTIKKEARGSNNEDLGEVQEITDGHVLVKRGLVHKEKFLIPQDKVESYDGSVLRFKISASEIGSYAQEPHPPSIEEQYESTTEIDSGGGSGGGIEIEETDVPLTDEKLDVSKETQEDSVKVTKEPIKETKTVEVQLTHEEVTIETRPPSGDTKAEEPVSSSQDISIPLKREEPVITKKPYVKEEVIVKKKPITETKTVSEDITDEEIKYDKKSESQEND
jgi:uncharacterized protein (TIGR02271 family)